MSDGARLCAMLLAASALVAASRASACVGDPDCLILHACLTNARCVAGMCVYDPVVCQNQGPCISSHCDNNLGCVYQPKCPNDGLACNGAEFCVSGDCLRTIVNCNDSNLCTIDYCQEPFGCQHDPVSCNDGDPCTHDTCGETTGCAHSPFTGCCQGPADCPDEPCRVDRTCVASFCSAGTPRDCDDGDPFTLDTCNPATGCVHTSTTPTTTLPGEPCATNDDCPSDADVCRLNECVGGGCAARPRTGFDAVACVCDRAVPAPCVEPLPRQIARATTRACAAVARAAQATVAKKRVRLVGRMERLMGRARRAALGRPGRALPAGCGAALGEAFEDAASRAAAFQQGGG